MADAKISELTAATTAAAADLTYLVQSSTSKSITVQNLFGNISTPVQFTNSIQVGDHDTITTIGIVATTTNVTYIHNPDGAGNLTIGTGLDGQIKIIIMSSNTGSHTLTLQGANVQNNVAFSAAGNSATMLYDTGLSKWFFIGGSATVS
jgi:hypothetical protein|tara:strand:- start:4755 stop:5201 length:447 start_codon:yes stop_codon:yes gene_type:complete